MSVYNFIDITGKTFGKWTVLQRDLTRKTKPNDQNVYWLCRCQCGTEKSVNGMTMKSGRSTQCRRCWEQGHKHNLNARVWGRILRNAKLREIPVDLGKVKEAKTFLYDLLHVKQNNCCALSGLPIRIADTIKGDMNRKETTASLDRIDSTKGYTRNNVQWVHKNVNKMKVDLDQSTFIKLCRAVALHHIDA
jgi:hypothetical protein